MDYERSRIKQYPKEGRALRTETTINDTRDFGIGRRLHNLPQLRAVGFQANRHLLDVQRISHDPAVGEDAFRQVTRPAEVEGQRASALPWGDPTVLALFSALLCFRLLPRGFSNRDLREHLAPLLGRDPGDVTPGQMTYQLRRLRLHGLIVRQPNTHRYRVTDFGVRVSLFFTRTYARLMRPDLAHVTAETEIANSPSPLRHAFNQVETVLSQWIARENLAA